MPVYRVSGFAFQSEVVFPELTPVGRAAARVRFGLARDARGDQRPRWYHRWRGPDGRDWATFGRVARGYLVRFPRLAEFFVSADATEVRCAPERGVAAPEWRHLFLHQVLPLVIGEHGHLVLHASAVVTPAGAVAFLGGAGQGKSTLAASFWAAGHRLIADDCLRIDERGGRLVAVPSYPGVRLWPAALRRLRLGWDGARASAPASGKVLVSAPPGRGALARAPVPLARVYVLGRPLPAGARPVARIDPLTPRETMAALVAHLYRLDLGTERREALARDFDRLASVAARLSARRLRLRRGLGALPAVHEAIDNDARGRP